MAIRSKVAIGPTIGINLFIGYHIANCSSCDNDDYPEWESGEGETHPIDTLVEEILAFGSGGLSGNRNERCHTIGLRIDILVQDLKWRRYDMNVLHGGGDPGHIFHYEIVQSALEELIYTAKVLGCNYNREADEEVNLPHDHPTNGY